MSFGGECRNRDGIACVERFGYSMCSDAVDDLYASSRTYFGSSVIIHETMHSFGYEGNYDHYGTAECNTHMADSSRPYNPDTWDSDEFQFYNGMCPYVYDNFVSSYRPWALFRNNVALSKSLCSRNVRQTASHDH